MTSANTNRDKIKIILVSHILISRFPHINHNHIMESQRSITICERCQHIMAYNNLQNGSNEMIISRLISEVNMAYR